MGDQHALRDQGRRRDPDRALRHVEHRPHEARVPRRPRASLRPGDAGDLGRAFQLFVPGGLLAGAGRPVPEPRFRAGVPVRRLLRAAAQLPAPWLDRAVPVRQLARDLRVLSRRKTGRRAPGADARHALRAARDVAADERSRLSQQEPGGRERLGQQPRALRARPEPRHHDAASGLRADRRQGRRRVPAAQRQLAADRERVLQLHPSEARRALGRTADPGAAARGRRSTSRCGRSTSAPSIRSASTR